jgi:hypothetical protein
VFLVYAHNIQLCCCEVTLRSVRDLWVSRVITVV